MVKDHHNGISSFDGYEGEVIETYGKSLRVNLRKTLGGYGTNIVLWIKSEQAEASTLDAYQLYKFDKAPMIELALLTKDEEWFYKLTGGIER